MSARPSSVQTIVIARDLIRNRGWVPGSEGQPGRWSIFGPEEGPLTVTQALWKAAQWDGDKVDPGAAHRACRLLCLALFVEPEGKTFSDVGRWCRTEGRTQEQVINLFNRAIREAGERLLAFIRDEAEEVAAL